MQLPLSEFLASYGRTTIWRCAYLGGTFDCLHRGHLALLANARLIAQEVVVGLNTDAFAARYKREPLMPLADRMAVLQACRLVDRVVVNEGDEDSKPAIERAGADIIVHGSDWVGESLHRQMGLTPAWLEERGITLVTLPYTAWTSTSQILEAYRRRGAKAAVPNESNAASAGVSLTFACGFCQAEHTVSLDVRGHWEGTLPCGQVAGLDLPADEFEKARAKAQGRTLRAVH